MENYLRDKVGEWGDETASRVVSVPACEHCHTTNNLTKHHLVPRSARRLKKIDKELVKLNEKMRLCEDCHVLLHQVRTCKELGLYFNTPEKVLELLRHYENSTAHERLNRLRFDEDKFAEVFEGSNMWN